MAGEIREFSRKFRDAILLAAWVGGILILGGLLWFFTQNFRDTRMVRTVNKLLVSTQDEYRLEARLPRVNGGGKVLQNVQRFSLIQDRGVGVVFTVFTGNNPAVCLAFVNNSGAVERIIPLNSHSAQVLGRVSNNKMDIYKEQIEENEKVIRGRE